MIWRKKRESAKNSEMDLMLILFYTEPIIVPQKPMRQGKKCYFYSSNTLKYTYTGGCYGKRKNDGDNP